MIVGDRPRQFMFSDRGSLTANVKSIQPAGVETIVVCEAGNQVVVVHPSSPFRRSIWPEFGDSGGLAEHKSLQRNDAISGKAEVVP